ncbi:low temperature requirement protein LtrA [Okibacterium sp. HSC-33S16]|nr:low temperature requirement protein LtrA [Okibacterium sp. HSC-33S16]
MSKPETRGSQRTRNYRLRSMSGRDPEERHRTATPLELLFDLTFVVAISQASSELSHLIAEGHVGSALLSFAFCMFAICWAWINFSWFASAYDTDDWFFRITTMVQMVGVLILALGLPAVFDSIDGGQYVDNQIVVAGYVVMRVAMIAQWLRAARGDPARRRVVLTYAGFITVAQVGWITLAVANVSLGWFGVFAVVLYLVELGGPITAETRFGSTTWHPHHIAERYGLLTIIALGEVILGTVASVSAVVDLQGWSVEAVSLAVAGIGLAFGLWWVYFVFPVGELLARHRSRSWGWGYGHIALFASVAAVGAGLHVAAYVVEGAAHVGVVGAITAVAVPVLLFCATLFVLSSLLLGEVAVFQVVPFIGAGVLAAAAMLLAAQGVSLAVCLLVVTAAPAVIIVAFEAGLHRRQAAAMKRALR